MSDGLSWAYEQRKAEEEYQTHLKSGKFDKEYLESDIIRTMNKNEISLLVVRLILHQLGGAENFFKNKFNYQFDKSFNNLSKKDKIKFLQRHATDVGLTINEDKKLKKLQTKIAEMKSIIGIL